MRTLAMLSTFFGESLVEVIIKDETLWCTQKAMAQLFGCSTDNIGVHLKNIYQTEELDKEATTEKISVVQKEGEREVRGYGTDDLEKCS